MPPSAWKPWFAASSVAALVGRHAYRTAEAALLQCLGNSKYPPRALKQALGAPRVKATLARLGVGATGARAETAVAGLSAAVDAVTEQQQGAAAAAVAAAASPPGQTDAAIADAAATTAASATSAAEPPLTIDSVTQALLPAAEAAAVHAAVRAADMAAAASIARSVADALVADAVAAAAAAPPHREKTQRPAPPVADIPDALPPSRPTTAAHEANEAELASTDTSAATLEADAPVHAPRPSTVAAAVAAADAADAAAADAEADSIVARTLAASSALREVVRRSVATKRGRDAEDGIADAYGKKAKVSVIERNSEFLKLECDGYCVVGKVDGRRASDKAVVEIKTRQRLWHADAPPPSYDVVQLAAYVKMTGAPRGVLVECLATDATKTRETEFEPQELPPWEPIDAALQAVTARIAAMTADDVEELVDAVNEQLDAAVA